MRSVAVELTNKNKGRDQRMYRKVIGVGFEDDTSLIALSFCDVAPKGLTSYMFLNCVFIPKKTLHVVRQKWTSFLHQADLEGREKISCSDSIRGVSIPPPEPTACPRNHEESPAGPLSLFFALSSSTRSASSINFLTLSKCSRSGSQSRSH